MSPSTIRLAAIVLAVTGMATVTVQSSLAQQATCDWYAKTALRQQQDNEQRKCGFSGPGWSSDMKAHMSWCAVNSPDNWKSEAQRREQQLSTCKR
jgi:hypothetical protein